LSKCKIIVGLFTVILIHVVDPYRLTLSNITLMWWKKALTDCLHADTIACFV